jgi:hypothetical protein
MNMPSQTCLYLGRTWDDDEIKKRQFVQNAQNIGLVNTAFEG